MLVPVDTAGRSTARKGLGPGLNGARARTAWPTRTTLRFADPIATESSTALAARPHADRTALGDVAAEKAPCDDQLHDFLGAVTDLPADHVAESLLDG